MTTLYPVSPETTTVLGYRVKASSATWRGLDLEKAELRTQSTLMLAMCGRDGAPPDLHLDAPWWHPSSDGEPPNPPEIYYRVRPRMEAGKRWQGHLVKAVAFERIRGIWWLAVEFARSPKAKRTPR